MINFKINPQECALLVVDVQVDFCSPDGATARRGRPNTKMQALPSKINKFVDDIKDTSILPIYIRSVIDEDNLMPNEQFLIEMKGVKRPTQKNTDGAEFYGLDFPNNALFVEKVTSEPFTRTHFKDILINQGIKTVVICGVRTEICVGSTARRAYTEGFNVIILSDLVATRDNTAEDEAYELRYLDAYVGFVMYSEDFLQHLE